MSTSSPHNGKGFVLAVHAGAGRRSFSTATSTTKLLRRTLRSVCESLPLNSMAADVVVAAISQLESSPLTNAGVGASLSYTGEVECDASLCLSDRSVGAVGAVIGVRHPVLLANCVRVSSLQRGPCGLLNHVLITGTGAQDWATRCGMVVDPECHILPSTRDSWHQYKSRVDIAVETGISDTVGAVCLDAEGFLASGASSGGNWLKPSGRLGAAAVPNAATAQFGDTAVSASGRGETMIRESFSLRCAMGISSGATETIGPLTSLCEAGMAGIRHRRDQRAELVFGHATESFCYGYYCPATMSFPICTASTSSNGIFVISESGVRLDDPG